MLRPDVIHLGIAAALVAVLGWAAISDIATRRIPNAAVVAILGLYGAWVIGSGADGVWSQVGAGAIAFAVGYVLYAMNVMGAGDVKLFAAVALFAGFAHLPFFAVATAISGGGVAVVSFVTRPRRAMVMLMLRGKGDFGRGIPYGVAIALGACALLVNLFTGWPALLS
jgi:prepilin peptidase CpaA